MADVEPIDLEVPDIGPADPGVSAIDVRRTPVPSERELELGVADYDFRPLPPPPPREPVTVGQRVAGLTSRLDPRVVAAEGPILPLVLLFLAFMFVAWDEAAFSVLLKEIRNAFHF